MVPSWYWEYYVKLVKKLGIEDQYKHHPMHVHLWRTVLKRVFGKYTIFRRDQLKILTDWEGEYYLSTDSNESGSTRKKMILKLDPDTDNFSLDIIDLW